MGDSRHEGSPRPFSLFSPPFRFSAIVLPSRLQHLPGPERRGHRFLGLAKLVNASTELPYRDLRLENRNHTAKLPQIVAAPAYCMGERVALEVAQQLHAVSEPTALLALFDTMSSHEMPSCSEARVRTRCRDTNVNRGWFFNQKCGAARSGSNRLPLHGV